MNQRIEQIYAQRPRRYIFELAVAAVVTGLLIWSGSAVETSGTTQNGAKIALNILSGIFHPDTGLLFNLTVQGVPYLLMETICIAFLGINCGKIPYRIFCQVVQPAASRDSSTRTSKSSMASIYILLTIPTEHRDMVSNPANAPGPVTRMNIKP